MVFSAAVASGVITAVQAWPDFFSSVPGAPGSFPSKDAGAPAFALEPATPESFAADMAALVASSSSVTLREPSVPPPPAPAPQQGHSYVPGTEWT